MSMNDQHLIDEIKASPPTAKPISNIPWYNVLANEVYQRDFNYFPSSLPDRSDYIVDDDSDDENDIEQSDMVKILINLAYVKTEVARNFQFKRGYSKLLGKEIEAAEGKKNQ